MTTDLGTVTNSSESAILGNLVTRIPFIAGLCLSATVILAALYGIAPAHVPKLLVAAPAWLAAALLWMRAAPRTRKQAGALGGIGLAGLAWGATHAGRIDPQLIFGSNALLIAMLAAVSFLRLITRPTGQGVEHIAHGRKALWSTLLGVHLFGAVINLSVVFIMGDRLSAYRDLNARQVSVLTRGFSAAAFWSPFFAAMAAALTYAPGAQLPQLMLLGIPLAALGLAITALRKTDADADFEGYPMHYGTLWLPGTLAVLVLALHETFPRWPILAIICMLAPAVTLTFLALSKRRGAARHASAPGPSGDGQRTAAVPRRRAHGRRRGQRAQHPARLAAVHALRRPAGRAHPAVHVSRRSGRGTPRHRHRRDRHATRPAPPQPRPAGDDLPLLMGDQRRHQSVFRHESRPAGTLSNPAAGLPALERTLQPDHALRRHGHSGRLRALVRLNRHLGPRVIAPPTTARNGSCPAVNRGSQNPPPH
jgi:hypothetical protein